MPRLPFGSLEYQGTYSPSGRYHQPVEFLIQASPARGLQSTDIVLFELVQRTPGIDPVSRRHQYHMDTLIHLSRTDALQIAKQLHDEAIRLRDPRTNGISPLSMIIDEAPTYEEF